MHALERFLQRLRLSHVIDAVQTAQAGIHCTIQVECFHTLVEEQRPRFAVHCILHGLHQHFRRSICSDHLVAPLSQYPRQAACAAGKVEHQLRLYPLACEQPLKKIRPVCITHIVRKTVIVCRQSLIAIHRLPSAGRACGGSRPTRRPGIC